MTDLVHDLLNLGVQFMMVGQVLHRIGDGVPLQTPCFNDNVMELNYLLRSVLNPSHISRARLWRHKYLSNAHLVQHPHKETIGPDGVHLNHLGNHRLFRSIRGAILYALAQLHNIRYGRFRNPR